MPERKQPQVFSQGSPPAKTGAESETPDPIPTWNRVRNSKVICCSLKSKKLTMMAMGIPIDACSNVIVSTELLLGTSLQPIRIRISK